MIALMIINLVVKLIFIFLENFFRVKMVWHRYLEPLYLKYIWPYLACCRKPPPPEEKKHELDISLDPNGFSSNYLIIQ